eukprot:5285990-Lingulodinium_polyedra.AAC.1
MRHARVRRDRTSFRCERYACVRAALHRVETASRAFDHAAPKPFSSSTLQHPSSTQAAKGAGCPEDDHLGARALRVERVPVAC